MYADFMLIEKAFLKSVILIYSESRITIILA